MKLSSIAPRKRSSIPESASGLGKRAALISVFEVGDGRTGSLVTVSFPIGIVPLLVLSDGFTKVGEPWDDLHKDPRSIWPCLVDESLQAIFSLRGFDQNDKGKRSGLNPVAKLRMLKAFFHFLLNGPKQIAISRVRARSINPIDQGTLLSTLNAVRLSTARAIPEGLPHLLSLQPVSGFARHAAEPQDLERQTKCCPALRPSSMFRHRPRTRFVKRQAVIAQAPRYTVVTGDTSFLDEAVDDVVAGCAAKEELLNDSANGHAVLPDVLKDLLVSLDHHHTSYS
jgi:hypothetical protein